MNWKFWKSYTITVTSKLGPTEITYTVTAPTKEEAKVLVQELSGDSS